MKIAYVIVGIFLFVLIILYGIGTTLMESCSEIGSCKICWKSTSVEVYSDLCPESNNTCIASPEKQEYNARLDVLLCACESAASNNYKDETLNSKISSGAESVLGYTIDAQTLCDQPGNLLVKRRY
jgi:hypothetical protein